MLPELSGARSVAPQAKTFGAMSFLQLSSLPLFRAKFAGHQRKWHNPKS